MDSEIGISSVLDQIIHGCEDNLAVSIYNRSKVETAIKHSSIRQVQIFM